MNMNDADQKRGLYRKYKVERMDGSSGPGGRHEHCRTFVLDIDHDPHAPAAIRGYVDSCRHDYPLLALDLEAALLVLSSLQHNGAIDAIRGVDAHKGPFCNTCASAFFLGTNYHPGKRPSGVYECRKNAPVIGPHGGACWPHCGSTHWCKQHSSR